MTAKSTVALELDDIQAGALEPRPVPYAGVYQILRIDDRQAGRELLQPLIPYLDSVASFNPKIPVSLAVALQLPWTQSPRRTGGVACQLSPRISAGNGSRAGPAWGRRGERSRALGETTGFAGQPPRGGRARTRYCPPGGRLSATPAMPHAIFSASYPSGNHMYSPADLRNMFGFADGIAHPAVEGSGIPGTNPYEVPLKAGEFVLGYDDEFHNISPIPQPEVLRRNGTYAVSGTVHTRVATFPSVLRQHAKNIAEEEWLSAKIVGRWPSGAPLALTPDKDDPELGADPKRNNAFMFGDDPRGLKCPTGAHVRRMNPRDSVVIGEVRLHRMIRRGTNYGQQAPRSNGGRWRRSRLLFAFVGAHLDRQFGFIQKEWANDGKFIGAPAEKDPLVSSSDSREFTIPNRPIRRHLKGLPAFVVNRARRILLHAGPSGAPLARRTRYLIRRRRNGT